MPIQNTLSTMFFGFKKGLKGEFMIYKEGGKIISKKPHACGSNEWTVERTGADVKLKCENCKRVLFFSVDQVNKMTKTYIPPVEDK